MPLTIIDTTSVAPGTRFASDVPDTDVLVPEGVTLWNTDNGEDDFGEVAIRLTGGGHDVEVHGTVIGYGGIEISGIAPDGSGNKVLVGEAGRIVASSWGSSYGLSVENAVEVVNQGVLQGWVAGLGAGPIAGQRLDISNGGTIGGNIYGVFVFPFLGGAVQFVNTGTVNGMFSYASFGSSDVDLVTNTGLMIGTVQLQGGSDLLDNRGGTIQGMASLGDGDDTLDNRGGTIDGEVRLGDGQDTFDNRGGTVTGTIEGNEGDDTFRVGFSAEVIDGGDGRDVLDFSASARGLVVSLTDASLNTREAKGDSYTGIEIILGSRFADALTGDDGENLLEGGRGDDNLQGGGGRDRLGGGAGRDRIDGGEGDDWLIGGEGRDVIRGEAGEDWIVGDWGRDVLWGGAGNDTFWLTDPRQGPDLIRDWGSSAGDDDILFVGAALLGGGLVGDSILDPTQFRVRADSNEARDADDRFVFRTSDATLWFDADGKGGTGPVLVADLQAGAVLTAGDIWLV